MIIISKSIMVDKMLNILTEQDYQNALVAIEPFLQKGFAHLSADEDQELARITALIDSYEALHYAMPFNPKTLIEMLELKMFERRMKQKDLAKTLGVTENRISEVLNGKRKVNIDLAKRIYKELQVDANFILEFA
jgi:HTH-type transcriptional regulator / antitoxin HigA